MNTCYGVTVNLRSDISDLVTFDLDRWPWELFSYFWISKSPITWKLLVRIWCNFSQQCTPVGSISQIKVDIF